MKTQNCVIFDLDNCLFDDRARIPFIDWTKEGDARYHEYHNRMLQDPAANLEVYERYAANKELRIVFFTARPVAYAEMTKSQLRKVFNVCVDTDKRFDLIMRNNGDHRKSVAVKRDMVQALPEYGLSADSVVAAYDDRQDIVDMYREEFGIEAAVLKAHDVCAYTPPAARPTNKMMLVPEPKIPSVLLSQDRRMAPHEIMESMAATFKERNAVYGDNFRMVAKMVAVLFPQGVPPELVVTDQWHLFELKLVKLSRFAISNLTHRDSIHDDAVYSAMIESILTEKGTQQ